MTAAAGVLPHIELANQVMKVLETTKNITRKFDGQTSKLMDAVKGAIEKRLGILVMLRALSWQTHWMSSSPPI